MVTVNEDLAKRSKFAYNDIEEDDAIASKIEKTGKEVIKLNRGDPPQYIKTPDYIIDAYVDALRSYKTGYVDMTGIKELREAVSDRYARSYKAKVSPENVIVTQGVSEALAFLNNVLINDRDQAILFAPYYPQYMPLLQMYGGSPIIEKYSEKLNWNLDIDSLGRSLKRMAKPQLRKVKYMMITNPNNPTGTVLKRDYLEDIVDLANEYGLFLVSDEIYDEIVYNGAKFTSVSEVANGVPHMILNGASKVYDSTGFRIGFMIIPGTDKFSSKVSAKLKDYATVRLSVNTPAQYAIAAAITNKKEHEKAIKNMVKEISDRVNYAYNLLKKNEYLDIVKPNGSFYIFPKIKLDLLKIKDDNDFVVKLLKDKNLQVTRGSGFGGDGHFRIVSLPTKSILKESVDRINDFCEENKKK
ncbi:aspartate/tyrosine/aromatic aminotransferase [Candidatus Mancarchaeum acidiphilum]|uniref:Aspartate/tyrosine/aromatic aminotransferase n=1 Tax=Candidatus Mancarchaeum acidiphilum TaxID=1920749 RepID=A0A218NNT7_9ARCH|nr:pyridoxal phosphate-dependent aminotransferase [Candidatus Mancarchaeum acidiphilum]ASI14104.1 aspartate/tyrosine/aromatic aminotransferase [Candidatus Mancarchaeum acidiphilum]